MTNEFQVAIPHTSLDKQPLTVHQTGDRSVIVPNFGTVNLTVQQQAPAAPNSGGHIYVPAHVDREYYNLFVLGGEEYKAPFFRVPRERALCEYMTEETKNLFNTFTPEAIHRITCMPSLFMSENINYGKAGEEQRVIYGFVSKVNVRDNDIKVYFSGYSYDISQQRINSLLDELCLLGNKNFFELNRTHWAIKRADLIQELQEAGIQVPIVIPSATLPTK